MFKAIIIDDESKAREAFAKIIERYFKDKLKIVALAASVKEGVAEIHKFNPDLVFLDIEMPGENGFKLFDYFDKYDFEVIFITAYKQYAINAIKNSAIDYLLKPVNYIDIQEALARFESRKQEKSRQQRIETLLANLSSSSDIHNKVALPTLSGYQMVRINHIMFCEADVNYTKIHVVGEKEILVSKTLKYIEDLLPSEIFFRIHKSYLINLNYVNNYINKNGQYVVMDDGTELDVAFRRTDDFVKALTGKTS